MNLFQLPRAAGILSYRGEQELGVDLNDGKQVVEVVRDGAGRSVGLLEVVIGCGEIDFGSLIVLCRATLGFLQIGCLVLLAAMGVRQSAASLRPLRGYIALTNAHRTDNG